MHAEHTGLGVEVAHHALISAAADRRSKSACLYDELKRGSCATGLRETWHGHPYPVLSAATAGSIACVGRNERSAANHPTCQPDDCGLPPNAGFSRIGRPSRSVVDAERYLGQSAFQRPVFTIRWRGQSGQVAGRICFPHLGGVIKESLECRPRRHRYPVRRMPRIAAFQGEVELLRGQADRSVP